MSATDATAWKTMIRDPREDRAGAGFFADKMDHGTSDPNKMDPGARVTNLRNEEGIDCAGNQPASRNL